MTGDASKKTPSRAAAVEGDPRWAAVVARDASADGTFFYSVKTTGVYCRPSCGARPARPENVGFHPTAAAAERAGFRPCLRCKPDQPPLAERQAAQVAALCRLIEQSDEEPSLEELARHAGLSVFHTHRIFKAVTGVTPKAYAAAHRARRVRAALDKNGTVTEAIYAAGYGSGGRFYEEANRVLGMTPTRYRAGGANMDVWFAIGECSLGSILVAATARGVCAILLGDDPEELVHDLERRFPRARLLGGDAGFEQLVAQVVGLVESPRVGVALPLDVRGTAFQQRVWQALRGIPMGATASYAEIASAIGAPGAARAVARACAANALAVAIPCHRVVRNDGELSGYRWGVERKRALLDREASASTREPGTRAEAGASAREASARAEASTSARKASA
ncbi:bifunctional DNA-binding transcriptional regulator/O6-methylguanine-DNA methyltransferase Ada [Sorangium sp. So ce315]|uniref:bifunctional DNA-binding transcriptional regulator/O6-methylguanine-DNA methyltransferase Ada n=1 Tax=Sorangium sp. So ce315 TaxID=3133299 RepID=UPI003F63DE72